MNTLYELVSPDLVVDVVDDPNGSLWLITVSLAGADSRKEAPQLLVMASNEQRAQDVAAKHEAQWLSDTEEEDLIAREGRLADFGACSLLARPLARQVDTLEALNELRKQMAKLDERMTNPDGKGVDDRPPHRRRLQQPVQPDRRRLDCPVPAAGNQRPGGLNP